MLTKTQTKLTSTNKTSPQKQLNQSLNGSLMRIIPDEKPLENEVDVSITIKDIKFGNKAVVDPEVTTIFGGSKLTWRVPFERPLDYTFNRVEDHMVFKFAVTSSGDLLGFIYLEIPQKFKSMKEFKLDDWFPVKRVETEETDLTKLENFVARMIINYKANRKIDLNAVFKGGLPRAERYEKMANTLKHKLQKINEAVDQYGDEGFKHLGEFEKKMLQKKIQLRNGDRTPTKKEKKEMPVNAQKNLFYAAKNILAKAETVNENTLNPKDLFSKPGEKVKVSNGNPDDYTDKLLKELAFTKKELIEAKQKLNQMEQGLLTVDNMEYKKRLDKLKDDILKEKAELTVQLKEQSNIYEHERTKLREEFEKERKDLIAQNEEILKVRANLDQRMKQTDDKETELLKQEETMKKRTDELENKERKFAETQINFLKEKEDLREAQEELEDIKQRLMLERQRIFAENEKYIYIKGDAEMREQQTKTREERLWEEKNAMNKEFDKRQNELDKQKELLQSQKKLLELEYKSLEEKRNELETKARDLNEERKNIKIENVRLWREKNSLNEEVREFMEWKKVVEQENKANQELLDKDYEYIDEQLQLIETNRREFDQLKDNLEHYEAYLEDQQRIQNEQQKRFYLIQKNFFEKLMTSELDVEELRHYAKKFGVDLDELEKASKENQKLQVAIEKQKETFRNHINSITTDVRKQSVMERRNTNAQRKASRIQGKPVAIGLDNMISIENDFKIKQEASDLLETLFMNACLDAMKRNDKSKDDTIVELRLKIEELENIMEKERKEAQKGKLAHYIINKTQQGEVEVKNSYTKESHEYNSIPKPRDAMHSRRSLISVDTLREPEKLQELKQDVLDLCDVSIDYIREQGVKTQNHEKAHERVKFIEHSKKVIKNIFKVLNTLHNSKRDFDNGVLNVMDKENEMLDHEIVRTRYEVKVKELVDYIKRIRDNIDFFNQNVDNDILTA